MYQQGDAKSHELNMLLNFEDIEEILANNSMISVSHILLWAQNEQFLRFILKKMKTFQNIN